MRARNASRAVPLAALSATEMLVPFVRMFILTHMLGPFEFGFAAALSAAYATVEQVTDTGLFRFVLATPRERYHEALRTAHGIALVRGVLVAGVFVAVAYPTSCTMVACGQWPSFMWLAPLTFVKGFENLELRVYERDYRYWPQLVASIVSHSCGLAALLAVGLELRTHHALIAYLIVQSIAYVALTHLLAKSRYRFVIKGSMTGDALRYSLPLMANGIGLAIMTQGDRLFIGATLGLETLGLYAVMILTAYVPTSGLFRLIGPIQFAGLMNSAARPDIYSTRLKLFSRAIPLVAAVYSLGWIVLGQSFVPLVFGERFVFSTVAALLIGLIVYLRICRTEPATSLLLQTHGTRRLAFVNQIPMGGLAFGATLTLLRPSLEALLFGMAAGEVVSLATMLLSTRSRWRDAWKDAAAWCFGMAAFPVGAGLFFVWASRELHDGLATRLTVGAVCAALIAAIAFLGLRELLRRGYSGNPIDRDPAPVAAEPAIG